MRNSKFLYVFTWMITIAVLSNSSNAFAQEENDAFDFGSFLESEREKTRLKLEKYYDESWERMFRKKPSQTIRNGWQEGLEALEAGQTKLDGNKKLTPEEIADLLASFRKNLNIIIKTRQLPLKKLGEEIDLLEPGLESLNIQANTIYGPGNQFRSSTFEYRFNRLRNFLNDTARYRKNIEFWEETIESEKSSIAFYQKYFDSYTQRKKDGEEISEATITDVQKQIDYWKKELASSEKNLEKSKEAFRKFNEEFQKELAADQRLQQDVRFAENPGSQLPLIPTPGDSLFTSPPSDDFFDGSQLDQRDVQFTNNEVDFGVSSLPEIDITAGSKFYQSGNLIQIADRATVFDVGVNIPLISAISSNGVIDVGPFGIVANANVGYRHENLELRDDNRLNQFGTPANPTGIDGFVTEATGNGLFLGAELLAVLNNFENFTPIFKGGVKGTFLWFNPDVTVDGLFIPAAPTVFVDPNHNPGSTTFAPGVEANIGTEVLFRNSIRVGVDVTFGLEQNPVVSGDSNDISRSVGVLGSITIPLDVIFDRQSATSYSRPYVRRTRVPAIIPDDEFESTR